MISPHFPGASHACLHFVDNHEGPRAVADFADALEEGDVAGSDTAFPLQSLHHDRSEAVAVACSLDALHLINKDCDGDEFERSWELGVSCVVL